jgi:hypothetical protein
VRGGKEERMELFVHEAGSEDPQLVAFDPADTVASVAGEQDGEALALWLEDSDEPLDSSLTLGEAGVTEHQHVHRARCRKIDVTIRYGGQEPIEREFGPAKTIKRVYEWATGDHGFPLSPDQRAKHVLALPGADAYLAWTVQIGSVADAGSCSVTLELYPKERFEG